MSELHILTDPLFIIVIGVLIVVGGIIGLRLHPFLPMMPSPMNPTVSIFFKAFSCWLLFFKLNSSAVRTERIAFRRSC